MVSLTPEEEAEQFKATANQFFKEKKYTAAIEWYTKAIEKNDKVPAYFGNRSIAYLRTECFGYAITDADSALALDRRYLKAYYRRAEANMALGRYKKSLVDYDTVRRALPKDRDAQIKFKECEKIVKKLAFERAINVDSLKKSIIESIDVENILVEDSYTGPSLSKDNFITKDFMEQLLVWYKEQKILHRKYAYTILIKIKEYFEKQSSLVRITIPSNKKLTVCGDIHGQFYDLLNIFEINGLPSEDNPYLFNGDFVDRGSFSVEVIFTLFGFKLLYPEHMFMARGNHESINMNQMYGFDGEVKEKYSKSMADFFTEIFNWLPLCHVINNSVFVTHGGLFEEEGITLDEIENCDRNRQPPDSGIMCDLLWSDPQVFTGKSASKRGVGVQFGPDVTNAFLEKNKLKYVIRSHEVKDEGYEVSHDGKCITVFSAPNYCDQMGNKGAFITLSEDLVPKFTTFEAVPHPDVKPMAYANNLLKISGFM